MFRVQFTAAFIWAILRAVMALTGLRVDKADETRGLDISIHAEEGYNL